MTRTHFTFWTEGSIVALITFFLLAAFPLSASGDTPIRSIGSANDLQGTFAAQNIGIFFPPNASLIATPSTGRNAIGGPADELTKGPTLLEIRRDPNAPSVYRSPVDNIFELNSSRTSVKPLQIEF